MAKTIMIVDDEDMILMLTEGILSRNYDVICARSGQEAIEKYGVHHPDLILSDILMPEMTGLEMLTKMREQYGRRIPTVFMTASEDDEAELNSVMTGAVDFIRKPLKADVLLKTVGTIFERLDAAQR